MKPTWNNEKELAKAIVDHLKDQGWTVYPELCDIDIIATKHDHLSPNQLKVIGIECKKHFNLTVLAQAHNKRRYVDEMYVGVTQGWKHNESFGCQIATQFGYGVYFVQKRVNYLGVFNYSIKQQVNAIQKPRKTFDIDKMLDPKAETFAEAGQAGGKHWSLFQKTAHQIIEYVEQNPGRTLKEIIKIVPHHYSNNNSAYSSLKKLIERNVIKQIECKNDCLYSTNKKDPQ